MTFTFLREYSISSKPFTGYDNESYYRTHDGQTIQYFVNEAAPLWEKICCVKSYISAGWTDYSGFTPSSFSIELTSNDYKSYNIQLNDLVICDKSPAVCIVTDITISGTVTIDGVGFTELFSHRLCLDPTMKNIIKSISEEEQGTISKYSPIALIDYAIERECPNTVSNLWNRGIPSTEDYSVASAKEKTMIKNLTSNTVFRSRQGGIKGTNALMQTELFGLNKFDKFLNDKSGLLTSNSFTVASPRSLGLDHTRRFFSMFRWQKHGFSVCDTVCSKIQLRIPKANFSENNIHEVLVGIPLEYLDDSGENWLIHDTIYRNVYDSYENSPGGFTESVSQTSKPSELNHRALVNCVIYPDSGQLSNDDMSPDEYTYEFTVAWRLDDYVSDSSPTIQERKRNLDHYRIGELYIYTAGGDFEEVSYVINSVYFKSQFTETWDYDRAYTKGRVFKYNTTEIRRDDMHTAGGLFTTNYGPLTKELFDVDILTGLYYYDCVENYRYDTSDPTEQTPSMWGYIPGSTVNRNGMYCANRNVVAKIQPRLPNPDVEYDSESTYADRLCTYLTEYDIDSSKAIYTNYFDFGILNGSYLKRLTPTQEDGSDAYIRPYEYLSYDSSKTLSDFINELLSYSIMYENKPYSKKSNNFSTLAIPNIFVSAYPESGTVALDYSRSNSNEYNLSTDDAYCTQLYTLHVCYQYPSSTEELNRIGANNYFINPFSNPAFLNVSYSYKSQSTPTVYVEPMSPYSAASDCAKYVADNFVGYGKIADKPFPQLFCYAENYETSIVCLDELNRKLTEYPGWRPDNPDAGLIEICLEENFIYPCKFNYRYNKPISTANSKDTTSPFINVPLYSGNGVVSDCGSKYWLATPQFLTSMDSSQRWLNRYETTSRPQYSTDNSFSANFTISSEWNDSVALGTIFNFKDTEFGIGNGYSDHKKIQLTAYCWSSDNIRDTCTINTCCYDTTSYDYTTGLERTFERVPRKPVDIDTPEQQFWAANKNGPSMDDRIEPSVKKYVGFKNREW